MRIVGSLLLAALAIAHQPGAYSLEQSAAVKATTVLKTDKSWDGQPIAYPDGKAEITGLAVEIAPGGETGWHLHPVPSFALVLEGELEVQLKDGAVKRLKSGEALAEVVNTLHNGRNVGSVPVKLAVFYAGSVGVKLSVKEVSHQEGYEALNGFVGTWTIPGQESTYQETCAWYHGERQIVCNTESTRKDGSIGHSMSILGFVPEQGFVYTGIGSSGRYETHEKGTFEDGILEYIDRAAGETTRIRIGPFADRTIIPFNVHASTNGTDWKLVESFNYIRVK